jgi:hypothetical protein
MSNHVWISAARQDPVLIQLVHTEIESKDEKKEIEGQQLNEKGLSVPPELCPRRIWGDDSAPDYNHLSKKMPDLFLARSQWIVSERAADVMRKFDLGGGALHPVSEGVFRNDGVTRMPGNYFCWIFGNSKDAFLPAASKNMRTPDVPGLWWSMPWKPGDDDVAVSEAALLGPEVWLDKMLFKSVFLSGPLGDALDRAGLRKAFRLFKGRVVEAA